MWILKRTERKKNAKIIKPPWWIPFKINAITIGAVEWRQASDKFITKDSSFYDLEHGDVVMADRGFQIQEDLLLHFCNLQVPLGPQTKS